MTDLRERTKQLEAMVAELRSQLSQLSRAKERQRELYQRTPAMLHSIDAEGRLLEVNDHWLKVLGYQRYEVLGRKVTEFLSPEFRQQSEQVYLPRFFERGVAENVPGQMVTKSGEVIDILISAISDRDEQGHMLRSLSVTRVVTEQKRAEEALQASEARYRRIIETALEGVWEVDPLGNTAMVNQRMADMLGYSAGEMLGRDIFYFIAPEEQARAQSLFERHRKGTYVQEELRFLTKAGQDMWARVSAIPNLSDAGEFLGGVAMVTDVTELKHKQRELRRERDRAQQYLDTAQVILLALDAQGRVELINRAGSKILGYASGELTGREWFATCLPEENREDVRRVFARIMAGEVEPVTHVENQVLTKQGESRIISWRNGVLRNEAGEIVGTFSSGEDVTERRQAERDLAASETRFRELVENIKEAFWIRDPESGKMLYLSPVMEEVFGLSRKFLYENPFGILEMVLPEDRTVVERALADQRVRGADTDIEYRIQRGDGQVRWVRDRSVCQRDAQGRAAKVLSIAEDITERKEAQLALAKSQEKFALVFRNSPLWVTISTLEDGIYLDANDTFSQITGYNRLEVIGRTSKEVGVWADPSRRDEAVRWIKKRGSLKDFEIDYVTRDGQQRHALWSAEPVVLDGRPCLISVLRDITRRKLAEKALRQANATLELAQNMARLGNWSVEVGSRWPVWSDQMFQILGRDPRQGPPEWEELLRLVHVEDRQHFQSAVEDIITTGQPCDLEVRVVRPEGAVRHLAVLCHAQPDDKGRVARLFGIVQDITERKRAEDALRSSEEQFRRLFEDAILGVFQSTVEGRLIRVNPAFARMFGYDSPHALLEDTHRQALACYADPSRRKEVISLVQAAEGPVRLENLYRRSNGSTFTGLQHVRLVRDDQGRPLRLEGFVEDVSLLKESQELHLALGRRLRHAQKMEAVGTLAGGIAHDFNNLLSSIMGYCELALADLEADHPSEQSLEQMLAAVHRAKDLVDQLLSFSRSAKGKPRLTDLAEIMEEARRLLEPGLPEGVELAGTAQGPLLAMADAAQVHQVIANLADNALQAMGSQGGVLSLRLERVELGPDQAKALGGLEAGDYARLEVSDTGEGMTPEVAEHAFDPFYTTREVGMGHGMGLAVAHGIVESHQGALSLSSEPGRGTTVTVLLPLQEGEPEVEESA